MFIHLEENVKVYHLCVVLRESNKRALTARKTHQSFNKCGQGLNIIKLFYFSSGTWDFGEVLVDLEETLSPGHSFT